MISKRLFVFLLLLFFLETSSTSLYAMFSDEEIVEAFTIKNHTFQTKANNSLTFSLYSSKPGYSSNPKYNDGGKLSPSFEDLSVVHPGQVKWDLAIPYRSWTIYINLPEEEKRSVSHIGVLSLREIFYRNDRKQVVSAFLILKNIKILESWEHKGIGRAVLTCFLEKLEALDSSKISHDIYIILGNKYPGVFKMYLEKSFNYFVAAESNKIFDIKKTHSQHLLDRLSRELSSSFKQEDVPTNCVMMREAGGKRFYQPYFY